MVDMPHKCDDGTAELEFLLLFDHRRRRRHDQLFHLVNATAFLTTLLLKNKSVILGNFRSDIRLDCLVEVRENVVSHQLRDELVRF